MKPFEIIRELRKAAGLTQGQMARLMGTSRPNYGQKENGNTAFTADELFSTLASFKFLIPQEIFNEAFYMLMKVAPDREVDGKTRQEFLLSAIPEQPVQNPNIQATSYFSKSRPEPTPPEAPIITLADKHADLTKQFRNQDLAIEINTDLVKIEKIDPDELEEIRDNIKSKLKKLEKRTIQKKRPAANGEE